MLDLTPEQKEARRQTYTWSQVVIAILPYVIAGAMYIALGVWNPRFLLSWAEGIIFLLLVVWALPQLYRRWRRK